MRRLIGLVALAPGLAAASGLDGVWVANPLACEIADPEVRLVIAPDRLDFHESLCEVEGRTPLGVGDAWRIRATCSGEGEIWVLDELYLVSGDGRLVRYGIDGFALDHHRCP